MTTQTDDPVRDRIREAQAGAIVSRTTTWAAESAKRLAQGAADLMGKVRRTDRVVDRLKAQLPALREAALAAADRVAELEAQLAGAERALVDATATAARTLADADVAAIGFAQNKIAALHVALEEASRQRMIAGMPLAEVQNRLTALADFQAAYAGPAAEAEQMLAQLPGGVTVTIPDEEQDWDVPASRDQIDWAQTTDDVMREVAARDRKGK